MPGSHNDIDDLERSSSLSDLVNRWMLEVNFMVNGNDYNKGYYLADGMYFFHLILFFFLMFLF